MKIVVDTNIIFSAILNSQSRIGQLILNGSKYFDFFTVSLLNEEILNHQDKILKLTGYSEVQFREVLQLLVNKIRFVDDILISDNDLKKALTLVTNIDEEDALFVALANHLHCNLWTGDKKLISGLKSKSFTRILSTEELYQLYLNKVLRSRK